MPKNVSRGAAETCEWAKRTADPSPSQRRRLVMTVHKCFVTTADGIFEDVFLKVCNAASVSTLSAGNIRPLSVKHE
jgi:hypothetical protein